VWNFLAGTVFVVSVGAGAYGAGKVWSGHHDAASVGMLIGGVAVAAACLVLVRVYSRRHQARLSAAGLQPRQNLAGSGD
jgi:membrane protein DedA with SNARE-associated domain